MLPKSTWGRVFLAFVALRVLLAALHAAVVGFGRAGLYWSVVLMFLAGLLAWRKINAD